MKTCPTCAERIHNAARPCPHYQRRQQTIGRAKGKAQNRQDRRSGVSTVGLDVVSASRKVSTNRIERRVFMGVPRGN